MGDNLVTYDENGQEILYPRLMRQPTEWGSTPLPVRGQTVKMERGIPSEEDGLFSDDNLSFERDQRSEDESEGWRTVSEKGDLDVRTPEEEQQDDVSEDDQDRDEDEKPPSDRSPPHSCISRSKEPTTQGRETDDISEYEEQSRSRHHGNKDSRRRGLRDQGEEESAEDDVITRRRSPSELSSRKRGKENMRGRSNKKSKTKSTWRGGTLTPLTFTVPKTSTKLKRGEGSSFASPKRGRPTSNRRQQDKPFPEKAIDTSLLRRRGNTSPKSHGGPIERDGKPDCG